MGPNNETPFERLIRETGRLSTPPRARVSLTVEIEIDPTETPVGPWSDEEYLRSLVQRVLDDRLPPSVNGVHGVQVR